MAVDENTKTEITANVWSVKILLVGMHAMPETNQRDNIFAELTATLCRVHWSVTSLHIAQKAENVTPQQMHTSQ